MEMKQQNNQGTDDDRLNVDSPVYDYSAANIFSKSTFTWVNDILRQGYRKPLEMENLGLLPQDEEALKQYKIIADIFDREKKVSSRKNTIRSLHLVYVKAYFWTIFICGILTLLTNCLTFVGPLCIEYIIDYVTFRAKCNNFQRNRTVTNLSIAETNFTPGGDLEKYLQDCSIPYSWHLSSFFINGYVLCVIFLLSALLHRTLHQCHTFLTARQCIRLKSAIQCMVYEKTLRLSTLSFKGPNHISTGQVINYMTIDAPKLMFSLFHLHVLWSCPFQVAVALLLMYWKLGVSAVIGGSVIIIYIPLQYMFLRWISKEQRRVMNASDVRVKYCHELIDKIRTIKLFAWENVFSDRIDKSRILETRRLFYLILIRIILSFICMVLPVIAATITFLIHNSVEHELLSPGRTISTLALFGTLYSPVISLAESVNHIISANVSAKRLVSYFFASEVDNVSRNKQQIYDSEDENRSKEFIVKIKSGAFTWNQNGSDCCLQDINIEIPRGKLTIVTGPIGSGKSSLISAILGEMKMSSGEIFRGSDVLAYLQQQPFILNGTIKENILFGKEYDAERLKDVVCACALEDDLDVLQKKIMTMVGDKGTTLSGGQKQRIGIARTLYSNADTILLDDPFSALDFKVANQVFQSAVLNWMIKMDRTVILVTHLPSLISDADKLIIMDNGRIRFQGNPAKYLDTNMVSVYTENDKESACSLKNGKKTVKSGEEIVSKKEYLFQKHNDNKQGNRSDNDKAVGGKMSGENRKTGSVSFRVYLVYLKACGVIFVILSLILTLARHSCLIYANILLTEWIGVSSSTTNISDSQIMEDQQYRTMYMAFNMLGVTATLFSTGSLYFMSLIGSRKLHRDMLHNLTQVSVRFFDENPVGRIVNRFASDISQIDQKLPETLLLLSTSVFSIISSMVLNIIGTWYFILPLIPIVAVYCYLQQYYTLTSRELQRLNNMTRSPVLSHFTQTLDGLQTIKAYKVQEQFRVKNGEFINSNSLTLLLLEATNRWLGFRLDILGSVLIFLSAIASLQAGIDGHLTAAMVGFCITYVLTISTELNSVVRLSAKAEMMMNSVERINEYIHVPTENDIGTDIPSLNECWPSEGKIIFDHASLRYNIKETVIKDANFEINPEEKVVLCGRTGSGKSSLCLSLFRFIDIFSGKIFIDGIDISAIPVHTIRSRLTIIPQNPLLFMGTLRFNLDPHNQYTDESIWKALEKVKLKNAIKGLQKAIYTEVSDMEKEISLGQRQLFCLARAILRDCKIVVLDEPTALVDPETNRYIHDIISKTFYNRTVITIAHQQSTIESAERVIVLHQGNIIQTGIPGYLLLNGQSDGCFSTRYNTRL